MTSECYYRKTPKGVVSIQPSPRDATRYSIWLDDKLICEDAGGTASDATYYAHSKAFPSPEARRIFASIWVPADLHSWSDKPPVVLPPKPVTTAPNDCLRRPWRSAPKSRS